MAVVITVAQQKGGAGKTMLAANLAACLADSKPTTLLDIDPQGSLKRWHALRAAQHPASAAVALSDVTGWRAAGELDRLRRADGFVLVDTPPVIDTDARRAIRGADLVVIPVQPSAPDLWAAEGTLKMSAEEKRPICVVLNRVAATGRARAAMERSLSERNIPMLAAALGNRAAFSQAFAEGLGAAEAQPRSVAAAEARALAAEILHLLARAATPATR